MVTDRRGRVLRRNVGMAGVCLVLASVALAHSPAAHGATDTAPVEGAGQGEAHPLTLCTAPWPPFVMAVPLPRPPGPKPDPAALGSTAPPDMADPPPEQPEPSPDRGAVGDGDGDSRASAPPQQPEEPPALPPLPGIADRTSGDNDANTGLEASGLEVLAIVPGSEAPVVPPPAPWTKRIARVAVANAFYAQRMDGSSVAPSQPPSSTEAPEAAPVMAEAEPDAAEEPVVAAVAEDGDRARPSSADALPTTESSVGQPSENGVDEDAPEEDTPEEDAPEEDATEQQPASALAVITPDAGLQSLSMPTARALMPQGRAGGPVSEIVEAACRQSGLDCRVSLVPWLRPGSQLDGGPCDAVFPVEDTPDTRSFMVVSRPVVSSRLAFFTLDRSIARIEDLTEFIVLARGPSAAAQHAARVVDTLEDSALVLGPDLTRLIHRFVTLRQSDRVALYGNYHVVSRAIGAEAPNGLQALGVLPDRPQTLGVGFSRARVPGPVIEAFNAGLERLHETDTVRDILRAGGIVPIGSEGGADRPAP